MARYRKNPGPSSATRANPPIDRKRHKALLAALGGNSSANDIVWGAAQRAFRELQGRRRDVLAQIVRTKGATDWVWLEETLSEATHDDGSGNYEAAFAIVLGLIRMIYPQVNGPLWFQREVLPTLRGIDTPDVETSKVIRDALEVGDDAVALQILLAETKGVASIFWNEDFFVWGNHAGGYRYHVDVPIHTHFIAMGVRDGDDSNESPFEAVGLAILFWKEWKAPAHVKISIAHDDPVNPIDDVIDDVTIFAIASSPAELDIELRGLKLAIG